VPDASTFGLFALASFALIVVPGPAVVYIVTRSLELGRSAGLVSMLGVEAGGLVHVTAAALGLSALIASSAAAFSVVKYLGAAYLIVIGVRRLVGRPADPLAEVRAAPPRSRLFSQGVLVSVLNPKVAIFFLAFLPQFVDPDRGAVAPQVLVLGTCFIALAMLSDGAYAFLAGTLGDRVRASTRVRHRLERASGAIYIALGAVAALAGRSELRSSS
jgi:threonine/homoserine/homoserine lactone efflux protein